MKAWMLILFLGFNGNNTFAAEPCKEAFTNLAKQWGIPANQVFSSYSDVSTSDGQKQQYSFKKEKDGYVVTRNRQIGNEKKPYSTDFVLKVGLDCEMKSAQIYQYKKTNQGNERIDPPAYIAGKHCWYIRQFQKDHHEAHRNDEGPVNLRENQAEYVCRKMNWMSAEKIKKSGKIDDLERKESLKTANANNLTEDQMEALFRRGVQNCFQEGALTKFVNKDYGASGQGDSGGKGSSSGGKAE